MEEKKEKERYGWWGKFHSFSGKKPRKIYIGPMSEKEMKEDFDEFRHNFMETKPA